MIKDDLGNIVQVLWGLYKISSCLNEAISNIDIMDTMCLSNKNAFLYRQIKPATLHVPFVKGDKDRIQFCL